MLRDHKEKIEEIMELNDELNLKKEGSSLLDYKVNMYNALEKLSKDTLDYLQTIFYIGREYDSEEGVQSPKEIFVGYLSYVKSFKDGKDVQIDYLSYNNKLSKYMKIGIDYIGWDIDNN